VKLGGREDAKWPALGFVVVALAAIGAAGWMLADSQQDQRAELRDRYADRVEVASALVGSLLSVAYDGSRQEAAEDLAGPVRPEQLDALVRRGGSRYAVLLEESGRPLAASKGTPPGTVDRLAARPRFVAAALRSRGGYGLNDLEAAGAVESAVVYPAAGGRRVLVTAAPLTTFRQFLSGTLAPLAEGSRGRAWVLDGAGRRISSVNAPVGFVPAEEFVRESLRTSTGSFTSPRDHEERFFAAGTVPGSAWRIAATLPERALYETASGWARWTPWIILAVGGLALLGVALLLRRLFVARDRLRTANDALHRSRLRLEERAAELERSNADLEQFAYAASHDLSEPLRTVAGFSQLLASRYRGRLDAEADEMIRYMGDGVERMQQLIDDLLLYSRVGRAPVREERVELDDVLAEARGWLGPAADEAGAQITSDPLPEVLGERGQLIQVFQNLLGNAIKFTAPGVTPSIHVSAALAGGEWRIAVTDNGIGVDPEQAEAIFKMFGRLHPTESYPGTGIGLALVKRIVERHGGRIWVERGEHGGSVFAFTLPDRLPRTATAAAASSSGAVA
jgi:signal transduction histidine kinase